MTNIENIDSLTAILPEEPPDQESPSGTQLKGEQVNFNRIISKEEWDELALEIGTNASNHEERMPIQTEAIYLSFPKIIPYIIYAHIGSEKYYFWSKNKPPLYEDYVAEAIKHHRMLKFLTYNNQTIILPYHGIDAIWLNTLRKSFACPTSHFGDRLDRLNFNGTPIQFNSFSLL